MNVDVPDAFIGVDAVMGVPEAVSMEWWLRDGMQINAWFSCFHLFYSVVMKKAG